MFGHDLASTALGVLSTALLVVGPSADLVVASTAELVPIARDPPPVGSAVMALCVGSEKKGQRPSVEFQSL
jgi:hypothetical protein